MELNEIKTVLNKRIAKYDKKNLLNPIEIQICNTKEELILLLFKDNNKLNDLIEQRVIYSDILLQWFTEQELKTKNIYVTGIINLYGTKNYYVLGDCIAKIHNDAIVFSYENASVVLRQKSRLYAYGNTDFKACDESRVIISSSSRITGSFHGYSYGEINNSHASIKCYEHSSIYSVASSNICLYDFAKINAVKGTVNIELYGKSEALLCNNSNAICYENSTVNANDISYAILYDNSCGFFNNNARGICYSAREVTCRDGSNVSIYQNVKFLNTYNYSTVKIMEMGTKLRAYGNSVIQDFADIYTEALDNSIIIWMHKHQIFKNQRKYDANVPFDYSDEHKC